VRKYPHRHNPTPFVNFF